MEKLIEIIADCGIILFVRFVCTFIVEFSGTSFTAEQIWFSSVIIGLIFAEYWEIKKK